MSEPRIHYYSTGQVYSKHWRVNGKYHRTDGPAVIWYYENGQVKEEEWFVNGKPHRTEGPVVIWYFKNGEIKEMIFYENGERLPEDQQLLRKEEYLFSLQFDKEVTEVLGGSHE